MFPENKLSDGSIITFNVFDSISKNLLFSKYNFNFIKYRIERKITSDKSDLTVFKIFLDENKSTWDNPYTIKQNLTQFFLPITSNIISYVNSYGNTFHNYYFGRIYNTTYIDYDQYIKNEFNLINYNDTQIRFIQDYYYIEELDDKMYYTKWNFNFDLYSKDFNIWGSKLLIFTDFVCRCVNLSKPFLNNEGYGLPNDFKKYFLIIPNLNTYIKNYGVTSYNTFIYKNVNNIDWVYYASIYKINVSYSKYHFYTKGQFELPIIKFIQKPLTNFKTISNFVVKIFVDNITTNGFLYKHYDSSDENIYLVTCYHILKNSDQLNVLRCILNIFNENKSQPIVVTADFEIIGYDIYSDVLVAKFNKNIPYNIANKVDLNEFSDIISNIPKYLDFSNNNKGNEVYISTNVGIYNNQMCYKGNIIDNKFSGFNNYTYTITQPDSLVVQFNSPDGTSGSPIFIGDPVSTDNSKIKLIGMVNSGFQYLVNHTQCISMFFLFNVVSSIITKQSYFNSINTNDILLKNYLSKYFYTYKWLGVISSYYNIELSKTYYSQLSNFNYTGGVLIEDFILGFSYAEKKFITQEIDLSKDNIIKIDTPLLKSNMYKRFIENSKIPIVMKSITFFNTSTSEYRTYYFGKYGNQDFMSYITYGINPLFTIEILTKDDIHNILPNLNEDLNFVFNYYSLYGLLEIEYYYYDF